jgi:predicted anti-sigma-YlaC factor YlaD
MRLFSNTGHLNEESLNLHALGDLANSGRVETHLAACGSCQERYKEAAEFMALLRLVVQQN